MSPAIAPDDDFGPQYGSSFDFTLKFDHTILQILPNAIIIVLAPWQIWHFKRQRQVVLSDALLWGKMAASVLLFFTQVASLVLCALSPEFHTSDSITAASLSCVAVSLVVLLLNIGHRYSVHSSGLLSLWLTSTCITDGTTARSYLLREHFAILGSLKIAAAVLKLSLVILEEWPKTKYEQDSNSPVSGDTVTGFWNRVLLVWLNKTMLFGYHNVLRIDNLLALDEAFDATALALRFHRFWTISNPKSKYRLAKASIRASIVPCLSIIFPRLSFTFFMFIQPFYIEAVVSIIQEPSSLTVKAALVGAASLIYFGVTISRSAYEQKNNQLSTIMRGMLVSAINVKTMDLPQSQRELSSAVTLMSTDVERVVVGIPLIFEFVFNLLEIGLGIYFLVTMVNQAAFLVAFPVFTGAFISWLLGKSLPPARVLWNEKVEDRVAKTSRMLSQLKAIKMIGLEQVATKHIHNLRAIEIKYSVKARVLTIVVNMTAGICNTLTPTLVFAGAIFWTTFKEKLTPIEVFKTVAFIALVTGPLEGSVRAYAETFSTLACIQRIQKYLLLPSVEDPRQLKQDFLSEQPQSPDDHINTVVGFHQAFLAPYAQPEKVILHDLNFALQKKNILIVTGPTGCGKSTLLQSFLGEVEKTSGVMFIEKGLAGYCDQSVWLRNVAVKENIVGYGVFHAGWYGRVLDTCLLREDLELWANGDQYLAGNNGSNLSGGQRQRVALARCLYSRAPFMVLDDVFSAVDNTTKYQIVGRLFGDHGLLRELETTVILATHSVDLFHVADKILFIRADGTSSIESDTDSSSFQNEISNILKYNDSISRRLENIESFDEQGGPFQEEAPLPQDTSAEQDEDNDELALRQRGDLDLHLFFLKTIGIVKTIVWLLITVGTLIIERFPDVFLRIWIDNAPENKTYFIGYALISLSSNFTGCGQLLFWYASAVPASLETLHQMLLDTVMKAKLSFLTRIDNGVLLNRFSQDMTGVSQTLPLIFMRTVAGFFYMFIGMVIILSATKYTGTAIPVVLGILYLFQRYYLRTSRQLRYLDLESKSPMYTDVTEMTAGLMHIRGFGWETQTIDRSLKLLNVSQKPFYYMFTVQRWLGDGMDFTVFLLALVTLTTALSLPHNSQLSGIALSLVTLLMFSNDMTRVIRDWTTLETSLGSIARIRSFVDSTPAEKDIGGAVSSEWPDGGNVVMTNVTASYGSEADVASVLQDISIDIPSGSRYGIIGRTGSGKSSLLLTLLNFLEYNGTIKIDGVDISTVSQQVLRSRITTISQDMVEFDESVRHNLCPWMVDMSEEEKDAQEHRVAELLARLGLWPLIRQHGGIDALVSDLGLSQGQKQLMAIARGLLHRRRTGGKLVLMDEVTSNLDWQTDALVHRLIKVDLADCTVITIGHRAIATHDSDKIVRISGGAIEAVEDGHPGEEVDVEDFPVPSDLKEQVEAIQQKRREAKSEGSRRISVQRLRAIFKRS